MKVSKRRFLESVFFSISPSARHKTRSFKRKSSTFTSEYQALEPRQLLAADINLGVAPQSGVLLEQFNGIGGNNLSALTSHATYPNSPNIVATTGDFASARNVGDNYGLRMRGYITAPADGEYKFWIASDNQGSLLLSDSEDANGATEIASVGGWTWRYQFFKYASQESVAITLSEGETYYIEGLMKEGGGGDSLTVAWSGPGISDGTPVVIDESYLTVFDEINHAPQLVDDAFALLEDSDGVTVAPLVNDVPIHGSTLTVLGHSATGNGSVTFNGDGTFSYTPAENFFGTDSFTYTVRNEIGATATATVELNVEQTSGLLLERFHGIGGNALSNLTSSNKFPLAPDVLGHVDNFEIPRNNGANYGVRLRGYLTAPETGEYTFWIAADDTGELWLSEDSTSARAVKIAETTSWTGYRQWSKFNSQQSRTISLVAGETYYIEALMKEGGGGDNLSVAWSGPGLSGEGQRLIEREFLTAHDRETDIGPVEDVEVQFLSQSSVRLNWTIPASAAGLAFNVLASSGDGQTFDVVARTEVGATAAIVSGLDAASMGEIRIAADSGSSGNGVTSAIFTQTDGEALEQDPGYYLVSLPWGGGLRRGSAGYSSEGTLTQKDQYIYATSVLEAAYSSLRGAVTVTDFSGNQQVFNFEGSGAFKVYQFSELSPEDQAAVRSQPLGFLVPDEQYLLLFEDSYGWKANGDRDYNDGYIVVDFEKVNLVDVDSTNDIDGKIDAEDDKQEVSQGEPGKVLFVNSDDSDEDSVPDFLDGFNLDGIEGNEDDSNSEEVLAEIVFRIPEGLESETLGGSDIEVVYSSTHLRVWSKIENRTLDDLKDANSGDARGFYIKPGTYSWEDFEKLGFSSSVRNKTFYIEALEASEKEADQSVVLRIANDDAAVYIEDTVNLTIGEITFYAAAEISGDENRIAPRIVLSPFEPGEFTNLAAVVQKNANFELQQAGVGSADFQTINTSSVAIGDDNAVGQLFEITDWEPNSQYRSVVDFADKHYIIDANVVPGAPAQLDQSLQDKTARKVLHGFPLSQSGHTTFITRILDQHGNPVAEGTPVEWFGNEGDEVMGTSRVGANGVVTGTIIARSVLFPGLLETSITLVAGNKTFQIEYIEEGVTLTKVVNPANPSVFEIRSNAPEGTLVDFQFENGNSVSVTIDEAGRALANVPSAILNRGANSGVIVQIANVTAEFFVHEIEAAKFSQVNQANATKSKAVVSGTHLFSLNGRAIADIEYPIEYAQQIIGGDPDAGIPDWTAPPVRTLTGSLPHTASVTITGTPGQLYLATSRNKAGELGPAQIVSGEASNYLADSAIFAGLALPLLGTTGNFIVDSDLVRTSFLFQMPADGNITFLVDPLSNARGVEAFDVTVSAIDVGVELVLGFVPSATVEIVETYSAQFVHYGMSVPEQAETLLNVGAIFGDAVQSFLGGDPMTAAGVISNVAGGILIVGDVGSLTKNIGRWVGLSQKPPNWHEATLSALGLLTELAPLIGEIPDSVISSARAMTAAIGAFPLASFIADQTFDLFLQTIEDEVTSGGAIIRSLILVPTTSLSSLSSIQPTVASASLPLNSLSVSQPNIASSTSDIAGDLTRTLEAFSFNPVFRKVATNAVGNSGDYKALQKLLAEFGDEAATGINVALKSVGSVTDAQSARAFRQLLGLLGGSHSAKAWTDTRTLIKALPDGQRGKAIGDLLVIITKSRVTNTDIAKFISELPSGLGTRWPLHNMLEDVASIAGVKGLDKAIGASNHVRWYRQRGAYHELFTAASLKKNGFEVEEIGRWIGEYANGKHIWSTDIDIVATRAGETFYVQAKVAVSSYAAGRNGGQQLLSSNPDEWLHVAQTSVREWSEKINLYDPTATKIWTHSDGNLLPDELSNLITDLDGLVVPYTWPGLP